VLALRRKFPDFPCMVMTADPTRARLLADVATVRPWALIAKPYRLDALLVRIGTFLPSHGAPRASWGRFGPSVARAIDYGVRPGEFRRREGGGHWSRPLPSLPTISPAL